MQAVNNIFSKSEKPFQKKPVIDVKDNMETEVMKNREKKNQTTWKTHIRTAVHSPKKFNQDNISNSISSAFTELSHDNELQSKKIRDSRDGKLQVGGIPIHNTSLPRSE
ncbi:hypothetical protein ACFTQL_28455 [Peribacillus butanolivorans]|uniref:hypothetical protein n=1 Tax=Peribacillus butanolivorans TaxID=421767 RepID=UPI00362B653F